ncbi:hypothetical protein, partial [Escherichia coli]
MTERGYDPDPGFADLEDPYAGFEWDPEQFAPPEDEDAPPPPIDAIETPVAPLPGVRDLTGRDPREVLHEV